MITTSNNSPKEQLVYIRDYIHCYECLEVMRPHRPQTDNPDATKIYYASKSPANHKSHRDCKRTFLTFNQSDLTLFQYRFDLNEGQGNIIEASMPPGEMLFFSHPDEIEAQGATFYFVNYSLAAKYNRFIAIDYNNVQAELANLQTKMEKLSRYL